MIGFGRDGTPVPWSADDDRRVRRSGRGFGRLAARTLERTLRLAERWRPDLVVSEPTEYAGRLAAAATGVPWVEHGWGLPPSPLYQEAAQEELAPELAASGLRRLPAPLLRVDVCPPRIRGADALAPPCPVLPMRYVPHNGSGPVPDWTRAHRDRPRACVTLGSLPPNRARPLLEAVVRGLAPAGVEVVLAMDGEHLRPGASAGPPVAGVHGVPAVPGAPATPETPPVPGPGTSEGPGDPGAQGPPPLPHVLASGWLPLDQVLPACDLVVHHGGPGTTMTAFVHGLPQLVLPGAQSDTAAYARVVADTGSGHRLDPAEASAERVEAACRSLLDDPSHRAAARSVADDIVQLPSPAATAAAVVERVLAARESACAR
ncbi:DUF1205 domain-containing protein [Streptomyces sp. RG38]|uniref:DUF1205 domain-containing protein n=2 Tax=Streptomyces tagetis TaxID=2820809 RepID=A0A940X8A9_9ACTN|nr:nucleotide disphospho-sugar-binding domain-containing protein [Streptomyces sp. RG38]MBQ0825033.1 DUF1205 domain-containing protein [Streptomyces sp. RG38]